ncbi:unnamed protein product, partial [Meganyctiphanes norvegica]
MIDSVFQCCLIETLNYIVNAIREMKQQKYMMYKSFPHAIKTQRVFDIISHLDWLENMSKNIKGVVLLHVSLFGINKSSHELDIWTASRELFKDYYRLQEIGVKSRFWDIFFKCPTSDLLEPYGRVCRLLHMMAQDLPIAISTIMFVFQHLGSLISAFLSIKGKREILQGLLLMHSHYNGPVWKFCCVHMCMYSWCDIFFSKNNKNFSYDISSNRNDSIFKEMVAVKSLKMFIRLGGFRCSSLLLLLPDPPPDPLPPIPHLYDSSSNRSDSILKEMADNGGVIMVTFVPFYLNGKINATVYDVIDHINHVRNVAGVDHVGIGSDFDGVPFTPEGLEDTSKYPNLFAELMLDPLWTEEDLKKLAGLNIIRALREVEQVKASLVNEAPWDVPIPITDLEGHTNCSNLWPEDRTDM